MTNEFVLNLAHIESLIDKVEYSIFGCATTCYLHVGDAIIDASAHTFDMSKFNEELGRKASYDKAINKLFEFEAYHQKQLKKEK